MSSYIDKNDCKNALDYYKNICKTEDEAYSKAADSLGISEDKFIELLDE